MVVDGEVVLVCQYNEVEEPDCRRVEQARWSSVVPVLGSVSYRSGELCWESHTCNSTPGDGVRENCVNIKYRKYPRHIYSIYLYTYVKLTFSANQFKIKTCLKQVLFLK